jgi:hypothetical protein
MENTEEKEPGLSFTTWSNRWITKVSTATHTSFRDSQAKVAS